MNWHALIAKKKNPLHSSNENETINEGLFSETQQFKFYRVIKNKRIKSFPITSYDRLLKPLNSSFSEMRLRKVSSVSLRQTPLEIIFNLFI